MRSDFSLKKFTLHENETHLCFTMCLELWDSSFDESRTTVGCTGRIGSALKYRGESVQRQNVFMRFIWVSQWHNIGEKPTTILDSHIGSIQ